MQVVWVPHTPFLQAVNMFLSSEMIFPDTIGQLDKQSEEPSTAQLDVSGQSRISRTSDTGGQSLLTLVVFCGNFLKPPINLANSDLQAEGLTLSLLSLLCSSKGVSVHTISSDMHNIPLINKSHLSQYNTLNWLSEVREQELFFAHSWNLKGLRYKFKRNILYRLLG